MRISRRFFAKLPETGLTEIGPLSLYKRKLANGILEPDEEQFIAVVKLQKFCESILNYTPSSSKTNEFSRRFILSQLQLDKLSTPNNEVRDLATLITEETDQFTGPKGIWLHGEVG